MPPFPGEETLATVFVDAHTYFGPPSPRPILHRFDKACYLYIYYNSTRHTSRLEVAVNPSTADQTAFNGFLDTVSISHSDKFPTRLTLLVGGNDRATPSPSSAKARDPDEWRLVSADPRDPGTTKYRIHTIDLYFWVSEDAKLILDFLSRLLDPHQLDIDQPPAHPENDHLVSSVVQNLENVAISDPAYHEPKQNHSPGPRSQAAPLPQPPPAPGLATNQQAPLATTSPTSSSAGVGTVPTNKSPSSDQSYAPLAYNPAAPAAPEPIAHREDTPPPVDGAAGTGLAAAAVHDGPYAQQHRQQYQQHPQQSYGFPPGQPTGQYGSLPTPSFGPQATSPAPTASFGPQSQPSFGPQAVSPPPQASPRTSLAAQTYTPSGQDPNAHIFGQQQAAQTPGTQFYQSINNQQSHKPLAHVQPQYPDYLSAGGHARPPSGYSNYQYAQQAPLPQPGQQQPPPPPTAGNPYDVHNQFYQPTETEHRNSHHHTSSRPHRNSSTSQQQQQQQHKPSNAEKIEKGVGKFFRKIEKKIG